MTLRLCDSPGAEQHGVVLSNVHVGQGQGLQDRAGQEGSSDVRVSTGMHTGMQHTGPCRAQWGLLLGGEWFVGSVFAQLPPWKPLQTAANTVMVGVPIEHRGTLSLCPPSCAEPTRGAGPRIFLPVESYWEPWQGHLNLFSACKTRRHHHTTGGQSRVRMCIQRGSWRLRLVPQC